MSPEDQLVYESRNRPRQVAIAVAAGVLLMLATVISLFGPHSSVSEQTLNLIIEHRRESLDLVAAVLEAIAQLTLGAALLYLWRCAKARSERAAPFVPGLIVVAVVVAAVTGIVYDVTLASKASEFVSTGLQTYDEANRLTSSGLLSAAQIGGQLAALLLAVSFILVSLQAMRVGLLPKMMGYVGMFCGILFLFPIIVIPIVQLFWFIALAMLLLGRWPDGAPPAWRTGRAEPWPSSAEMRARRMAQQETAREQRAARKRGDHRKPVSDAPAPPRADGGSAGTEAPSPATASTKRKRKRRH